MSILSKKSRILTFVIGAVFALPIVHVATNGQASNTSMHNSPYQNKKLSAEELQKVIQDHAEWLRVYKDNYDRDEAQIDKRRANLNKADLSGANLSNVDLSRANLDEADLSEGSLWSADLSGAKLKDADLSGADLGDADLRGARLWDTHLSGAELQGADLNQAVFEPKALPEANAIATAMNLALMYYTSNPEALIKLRKAFKEAGFYEKEREITYAINHYQTTALLVGIRYGEVSSFFKGAFSYVFFDRPTLWGKAPGRALQLLLALIPAFAIPYVIALRRPGENGIWRKWSDDCIRAELGSSEPIRLRVGGRQALALGLYFSVLSAFNIGWRDLNVSNWIQRLQANEYTLRATGWVRTVSGVQALISVYLLVIWVLTYFGRPFE